MRAATLTLLTLLGLVAGAFYGQYALFDPLSPIDRSHWTHVSGDLILVRPMMLLALPLVFAAAASAAMTLRSTSRFGLALAATLSWFALTMLISSVLGVAAATLLKPGELPAQARESLLAASSGQFDAAADIAQRTQAMSAAGQESLTGAWLGILRRVLPDNLMAELIAGRLLGLIVLASFIGLGLSAIGERGSAGRAFFDSLLHALRSVVRWWSWISPAGVFLLVANAVGSVGFDSARGSMQNYGATMGAALAAHAFIILPLALLVLGRCNPIAYAWRTSRALATAFGTSSSLAALPVAMEAAVADAPPMRNGQAARTSASSNSAANLVLPLGATLNFNGTAIFQAAAVVFLCQMHGLPLETSDLVVIVITTTIAAISTAGVPAGGLVSLVIVIAAVNTSLAVRNLAPLPVSAIGMLIALDRVLDMLRTTVNVWGNLVGARIVSVIAPDEASESNEEQRRV
jgi:Na+/H+-dicarboxylate symporter